VQLTAAPGLRLAVDQNLLAGEQIARLAPRIDQICQLEQLAEPDHVATNRDLPSRRHLWECGDVVAVSSPHQLPQLAADRPFVTDGGMETDLIFNRGVDLPLFAAFVALDDAGALQALRDYYEGFFAIARTHDAGLVLDTPTWRANRDWGERLGYKGRRLAEVNRRAVELVRSLRDDWARDRPVVIDGAVGPRGDGYVPGEQMGADEAAAYHGEQIESLTEAGVEMVTVLTMNYAEEAVGVARAAAEHGVPAVISFTVETDGRLPTGQGLGEAIDQVDAETGASAAYFMVNCAHPTHFEHVLHEAGPWRERVRGVRANASTLSHAELDQAEELDAGDPAQLAQHHVRLHAALPNLAVVGGCCGTDQRHVAAICGALWA
jgi:S-methylmethionine-dependent homocysteine/selenocysteine methylase